MTVLSPTQIVVTPPTGSVGFVNVIVQNTLNQLANTNADLNASDAPLSNVPSVTIKSGYGYVDTANNLGKPTINNISGDSNTEYLVQKGSPVNPFQITTDQPAFTYEATVAENTGGADYDTLGELGLTLSEGGRITGTVPANGGYVLGITAKNVTNGAVGYNTDFKELVVRCVTKQGTSNYPKFSNTLASFASPSEITKGSSALFSAFAYDDDGDIITYFWDFGDGNTSLNITSRLLSPNHVYGTKGGYSATVVLLDGDTPFQSLPNKKIGVTVTDQVVSPGDTNMKVNKAKLAFGFKSNTRNTSKDHPNASNFYIEGDIDIPFGYAPTTAKIEITQPDATTPTNPSLDLPALTRQGSSFGLSTATLVSGTPGLKGAKYRWGNSTTLLETTTTAPSTNIVNHGRAAFRVSLNNERNPLTLNSTDPGVTLFSQLTSLGYLNQNIKLKNKLQINNRLRVTIVTTGAATPGLGEARGSFVVDYTATFAKRGDGKFQRK